MYILWNPLLEYEIHYFVKLWRVIIFSFFFFFPSKDAIQVVHLFIWLTFLLLAGDIRANQNTFLTPVHVMFLRMHNNFAREFGKINSHWDDERLYQEARKAIIGIIQWITYEELLPILIGESIRVSRQAIEKNRNNLKRYNL